MLSGRNEDHGTGYQHMLLDRALLSEVDLAGPHRAIWLADWGVSDGFYWWRGSLNVFLKIGPPVLCLHA